ncbi:MAG: M20/M25/M40 family metallo-hydrolase [bacterium]
MSVRTDPDRKTPGALLMAAGLLLGPLVPPPAGAVQADSVPPSVQEILERPGMSEAQRYIVAHRDHAARMLVEIGGIVSPSGQEQQRAEAVAAHMRRIGLREVRVDGSPNAVGVLPGRSDRALVFIATLDDLATVAGHQRAAGRPPRIDGDRVVGPGTNTSSITAAMLLAAEALAASGVEPPHDLVFAAVAQEETGLVGMRVLHQEWSDRALAFIDILGDGRSITYGALGIHWWKVVASGPGGHSLGGGLPNVNQGIGRAVDRILQLPQPAEHADRRTVINIAQVHSGSVYNHKPESGWFSLDIRSLDAGVIEEIEEDVRSILSGVGEDTGVAFRMEPFQITPGGQIPGLAEAPLVERAADISRYLGHEPRLSDSGSSNMNVAIGAGSPAIGLGGSRGGARGQPEEWADIPAMLRAARHVALLAGLEEVFPGR